MSLALRPRDVEVGSDLPHPDRSLPVVRQPTLVIGGAGFIGSHLARRLLECGEPVLVLDSLAKTAGIEILRGMRAAYGEMLEVLIGDVRDRTVLRRAVGRAGRVYHLAGRTSPSGGLVDPMLDFEVNLRATVDLLEELRRADHPVPLVYASTSKVYGAMRGLQLVEQPARYAPVDPWIAEHGIDELWPLEVASPYGCSRAGADQYVLEYARSFRLPAVVARIGGVYGPYPHSGGDDGWVSHCMTSALEHRPVTIEGDGKQVRDLLHVFDLGEALVRLMAGMEEVQGHVFNVGGGPASAMSLRELLEVMSEIVGAPIAAGYADWRDGDPRYFVSCTGKLEAMTGWQPSVGLADGLGQLHGWLMAARRMASAPGHVALSGAVSG